MNPADLATALSQMGVTTVDPTDPQRPALYLPELRATRTFLTTTLAGAAAIPPAVAGLGPAGYAFCRAALNNSNLLQQLAELLDLYIGRALSDRMDTLNAPGALAPIPTLVGFYNTLWNPVDATYVANRNNFLALYPVTQAAVAQLTQNFQNNIRQACLRIIADQAAIENFFSADYPGLQLRSLTKITSSGSDFHKGGKQVLFLEFSAFYLKGGYVPWFTTFKLVYKPSDIEIDCLIAGNSAAINAAVPNFMQNPATLQNTQSLIELFNALRTQQQAAVPTALPLPTYKILPRVYMSPVGPGNGPPFANIRDLYGYIEYLSYLEPGGPSILGYYALGSSDCVIYRTEGTQAITDFYQQMGQLAALACTFSLTDLHVENVRVRGYQPYLIDLELSLGDFVQDVGETALLGGNGGITGYALANNKFRWRRAPPGTFPNVNYDTLQRDYPRETFANRLFKLNPIKQVVGVEPFTLLRGLSDGLTILANAAANYFTDWWGRLGNVLVRDLPYNTPELKQLRTFIYFGGALANPLANVITQVVDVQFTQDYPLYVPGAVPKYLALAPGITNGDYANLDLPIFYRRVDQLDIVDSLGNAVPIPPNVMINGVLQPSNVGRVNYYPATLLPGLQNPLAAMTGVANVAALNARINTLQTQLRNAVNGGAVPAASQFTFTAA